VGTIEEPSSMTRVALFSSNFFLEPTREDPRVETVREMVADLPPSLHGEVFGVEVWQLLALIGLVFVAFIIRKIIHFVVANRLRALGERLRQNWVLRFVDVFASPGATLAMAVLIRVTYPALGLPDFLENAMVVAVRVLFTLSIVWAAYRLVDVLAARLAEQAEATESKLDDQLVPLVRKSLKILVVLAGGLFILQNLDIDVGSLLAGLGIGGLAFALAAKDTVANFFGSLMIFIDRPFQIGDWIVVKGTEGIVEEVGFRSTRVRTFYNSVVSVPNMVFTDAHIDNFGRREYRRTFVTLNLTYDTTPEQMQAFVEGVRAIILNNSHTRKDYYEVHMSGFGAHSLDVMVYFFFKVKSWTEELAQRHNVYLEILRLARELGVEFAFPTQTLHVDHLAEPGAARNVPEAKPLQELAGVVRAFSPGGTSARPSGPFIIEGGLTAGSRAGGDGDG
jgi:MscS family membrane protein